MFTGIIKEIGKIRAVRKTGDGLEITVSSEKVASNAQIDDSVAVNGVCLTVIGRTEGSFTVQAVSETVHRTNISKLASGTEVNLEPALRSDDRLGGHIVQGHIDGKGFIRNSVKKRTGTEFYIDTDQETALYIVKKGSVCIDGISLTVAEINGISFRVAVIPHTLEMTTSGNWKRGTEVNIETDILGRYVEKLMKGGKKGLTEERLKELGY